MTTKAFPKERESGSRTVTRRVVLATASCYLGVLLGLATFHLPAILKTGMGAVNAMDIVLLPFVPLAVVAMAVFTPGPNITLLAGAIAAVGFCVRRWPLLYCCLPAIGFGVTAYWQMTTWRTQ